ncbi:MAG: type II toxin-antitoxin system VapC family toxin [Spirochaetes bacterium]|nr:MAG: type II toxin-antitoxin system VapC family toxin [Spirochaetota bacterium]
MKKYALDTNALVSFVTDRDERQRAKIFPYFTKAAGMGCALVVTETVLSEFVYVLSHVYSVEEAVIAEMIKALAAMPGISTDTAFDLDGILELWPGKIRDYGDAVLGHYAGTRGIPVLSFDKKLISQLKKCGISAESP